MRLKPRLALLVAVALSVWIQAPSTSHAEGPDIENHGSGSYSGYSEFARSSAKKRPAKQGSTQSPKTRPASSPNTQNLYCVGTQNQGCAGIPSEILTREYASEIAQQLLVHLQLPDATPQVGPDPEANRWGMAAVGYPLWLWTSDTSSVRSTVTAAGHTFTMRARYRSTEFSMGDGRTITCTSTTRHSSTTTPGETSPTCGYRYQRASSESGYTLRATTSWTISWSVAGYSGSFVGRHSGSRQLQVGELQAVVVR